MRTSRRPRPRAVATILAALVLAGGTAWTGPAAAAPVASPATATSTAAPTTASTTASTATAAFPSVNGQWDRPGPYAVTVHKANAVTTVYRPTDLGRDGVRHPVILWGNGTFAWPAVYEGLLRHWASHGFIVAAANTSWAGSGREMLAGATWLAGENGRPGSVYHGKVDTSRIGATGHSQGGGGAIAAGADPRVDTTVPIQPGPQGIMAALHGPVLLLAGEDDDIVQPWLLVLPRYLVADHVPAVYAEARDANHFEPVIDGGVFRGITTAWFRYWLMDDPQARDELFGPTCGICQDRDWSDVRHNAKARAIAG